jgi:hypothetical protein
MRFKLKVVGVMLLLGFPLAVFGQGAAARIANYAMDVRLDTARKMIIGREVLTWTNTSADALPELWFHLYWNAFANNASTFMTENRRDPFGRLPDFNKEACGYSRIDALRILKGPTVPGFDLKPSLTFRHPDDANELDRTVFSVRLPKPLPAGATIVLEVEWQGHVPPPLTRSAVIGDYYLIGQWFPKIGVYLNGQWNCHQYHESSEFFADYGSYDVRLTLPARFVVGATGRRIELVQNPDGTARHRFVQSGVHDFAWAASPRFLEYRRLVPVAPDRSTETILLLQPEHRRLKERYLKAIEAALTISSRLLGSYPYETVTCVDPAHNSESGGMEYPTFFTAGAYFLDPVGSGDPEGVTIHEFGHGYFYGLLGSNEFENPWMDEGFTSFLESEIYDRAYGPRLLTRTYFGVPVTFKDVKIPVESTGISEARTLAPADIMQTYAWNFLNPTSYGANSYSKAEVMLRTLKRVLGKAVFRALLKDYSLSNWYRHPTPRDFYRIVNQHAGRDMSGFLDQFVYGSGTCDYALESIHNRPALPRRGWFDGTYVDEGADSSRPIESEVVVRRLGDIQLPVEVEVVFENGRKVRESWDGRSLWRRFVYRGAVEVERAVVDPDFKIVADTNRTNNSLMRRPNRLAPWKWTANWLGWLQHALEFLDIFGG